MPAIKVTNQPQLKYSSYNFSYIFSITSNLKSHDPQRADKAGRDSHGGKTSSGEGDKNFPGHWINHGKL